eukprot:scaffold4868_cov416-Prasinococcus_capsulatus_cf.AAC.18
MVLVGETEQEDAQAALFSRHPEMRTWPAGHDFQFWKLQVHHLFLLDFYGGAPDISVSGLHNSCSLCPQRTTVPVLC